MLQTQTSSAPAAASLLTRLQALGPQALQERADKAKRILRDDGATYNVYSENTRSGRVWELDLVPSVLEAQEWRQLEAALLERTQLFNLMLQDFYGPRDLVRAGVVPPELLFAHNGFLRACQGIRLQGEHQLILHSVDMLRRSDGSLCVITDRTQAPSGAGYALENRTVMSRVLPNLFRETPVRRLAEYFQQLRDKLASLAPWQDEPRVVVLTPGAYNETFFEHAFLANHLGYPLVQSGDLMVNNGFVWMKSLEGLIRVDVILRRTDDWFCDPLELKSDSQLGIPGLLEVARLGRVAIANPLGAGVLENPGLLKYLPAISQHFLGRPLQLDSVPSYWCGDSQDLEWVLAHLDQLVVRSIYRGSGFRTQMGPELSRAQLQALAQRLRSAPHLYVAQALLQPSHLPVWLDQRLVERPANLRTFAVANSHNDGYSLMPGGLTRVGREASARVITNQAGSVNKDTWVLSESLVPTPAHASSADLRPLASAQLGSLPSRVVENLFWFGRYAERAEAALRLLRTTFVMLNGAEALSPECRRQLLRAVTQVTTCYPGFMQDTPGLFTAPEAELRAVLLDTKRFGSLRNSLDAMLVCAEETKELLSSDTLRIINDIRDGLEQLEASLPDDLSPAPEEALDPLVTALLALSGLLHESMIRGVGWRFLQMGRRLERSLQTLALVQSLLGETRSEDDQTLLLQSMLLTLEVLITYRRRYRGRMEVVHGLELVLIDTSNPRSLLFQLEQLQKLIDELPPLGVSSRELLAEQRAILDSLTRLRLSRLVDLANPMPNGKRQTLLDAIAQQQTLLQTLSNLLSDKYFDHRTGPTQLVPAGRDLA
jgi:uncharacterized circularly permuted ATP-grasp superfamily protein/uncharacterized alpha-E superfamily protein